MVKGVCARRPVRDGLSGRRHGRHRTTSGAGFLRAGSLNLTSGRSCLVAVAWMSLCERMMLTSIRFVRCTSQAVKQQKTKEQKAKAAMAGGGKGKKKKWAKGKVREKAFNMVLFDKPAYEKLISEVPKMKLISVATVVERLKVNGSLARRAILELEEKGLVKAEPSALHKRGKMSGGAPRTPGGKEAMSLMDEVEGLMFETSLVINSAEGDVSANGASEEGDQTAGGGAAARAGAHPARCESPVVKDLRRVMALLEKKEADLELAAQLGDALFQENMRLRNQTERSKVLQEQLENKDEELSSLRDRCKGLERRVATLADALSDADSSNNALTEQLAAAREELQQQHRHQLTEEGAGGRTTQGGDAKTRSVDRKTQKAPVMVPSSSPLQRTPPREARVARADSAQSEEGLHSALEVAQGAAENWRMRALEAEKQHGLDKGQHAAEVIQLQDHISALRGELEVLRQQSVRSSLLQEETREAIQNREELEERVAHLHDEVASLSLKNAELCDDLDEHKRTSRWLGLLPTKAAAP
ncbi:40S ribosomal protein S25 (S31) [Durusdinium trenchii]|uniref:40S ribosomal protein S25 (S31) n=1 Tax=Durusdinium trenchii TaxID=1381693 RepID=A0ABP0R325_9DINO